MRLYNFGVEYHLVDSCNLNCAACSHYSSLVDKLTYTPIDEIIKDLTLLKNKVDDNLKFLRLLGGEPLLHPDITQCLFEIRNIFPHTEISIVTNGLLLNKMEDDFYQACSELNVIIRITDYKIIDLSEIIKQIKGFGIKTSYYKSPEIWNYQNIRLTDDRIDCLSKCILKNICNNYRNGKIYLCPHIAYIEYFNKHFNKNIELNETDYIDINTVNSFDELIEKIQSSKPNFCYQYCNGYDRTHPKKGKWSTTKKDINEFCLQ